VLSSVTHTRKSMHGSWSDLAFSDAKRQQNCEFWRCVLKTGLWRIFILR